MAARVLTGYRRDILLFAALGLLVLIIFVLQGSVYSLRMLVEAGCYAVIALGLTIQWGYAGLFNVGVMGFIAAGAAASMLISFPANPDFWNSDGPSLVGWFLVKLAFAAVLVWLANISGRFGVGRRLRAFLIAIVLAFAFILVGRQMDVMATSIESTAGWVGGLGLPVVAGWAAAGVVAGVIAWLIGKICLDSAIRLSRHRDDRHRGNHQAFPQERRLADPWHAHGLAPALAGSVPERRRFRLCTRLLSERRRRRGGHRLSASPAGLSRPLGPHDAGHPGQ